jgi:hypothetical protein
MNTEYPGTKMNAMDYPINEKQLQTEDVVNKDVLFEQIKRLYLALKELNQRLQSCLQGTGLESH